MKKIKTFLLFIVLLPSAGHAEYKKEFLKAEGPQPIIVNPQEKPSSLYDGSFALVIANSKYKYWDELPAVRGELDEVTTVLRKNGFDVIRLSDLDGAEMRNSIYDFFQTYGRNRRARIVFYYSGHGYLDQETDDGYLVPVDAQKPGLRSNLLVQSMAMEDVRNIAMRMPALQGMFVFDNCYSGMVFKSDGEAPKPVKRDDMGFDRWRTLRYGAGEKGRQFIAAGDRKEILPSKSPVASAFVQGLNGAASLSRDGYVTGQELALFIQNTASTRMQNPRYLSLGGFAGDMVFQPGGKVPAQDLRLALIPTASVELPKLAATPTPVPSLPAHEYDDAIPAAARLNITRIVGDAGRVRLSIVASQLLITGVVRDRQLKSAVNDEARRIKGLTNVINEVEIDDSGNYQHLAEDEVITGKIMAGMSQIGLAARLFRVITDRGTVYLRGRVTQAEGEEAVEVARSVAGVQKVVKMFEYVTDAERKRL